MSQATYNPGVTLFVNSTQTSKTFGILRRVEYDRRHGNQYYVQFMDEDMGFEFFWLKPSEIMGQRKSGYR
jgi:hypothetical protein